jgi:hypothetical protein
LVCSTGLPDGLLANQKTEFGQILEVLAMENLCIFYDHLVYFTAIVTILQPFGIFCGNLVYFSPFWYIFHPFGIFFTLLVYFSPFHPFGIFFTLLVYFSLFWYIFHPFGILDQEKSGNPAALLYTYTKWPKSLPNHLLIIVVGAIQNQLYKHYV